VIRLLHVFVLACLASLPARAGTVTFEAEDGVLVTADALRPETFPKTVIVLFHMAGASRGEYLDIAKRLNRMGYATLAVDQRSGGMFNGIKNETAARFGRDPGYAGAIPDLKAAVSHAREKLGAERIGVIGSSYSAALVLVLAGRERNFADAVMAFSPGEYFSDRQFVKSALAGISVPVFLTAARSEAGQWRPFADILKDRASGFVPKGNGRHGATALLSSDGKEYWAALEAFLTKHLPAR